MIMMKLIVQLILLLGILAQKSETCQVENMGYFITLQNCSNISSLANLDISSLIDQVMFHGGLTIKASNFSTIPPSAFRKFTNITRLFLSDLHIQTILPGAFDGLSLLKVLLLNNNELSELPEGVFNCLTNLEDLNLFGNRIFKIHKFALLGVDKLYGLELGNNSLSKIDDNLFERHKHLKYLSLSWNPLEEFHPVGLSNLSTLELTYTSLYKFDQDLSHVSIWQLNLSWNHLRTVDFSLFPRTSSILLLDHNEISEIIGTLNYVENLNISHNKLEIIRNFLFKEPNGVSVLDFSFNNISKIEENAFHGLSRLYKLRLNQNKITKIESTLFRNLTTLRYLILSHNQIEEFQRGTFDSLTDLEELDLSHNKLTDVYQETFNSVRLLTRFYFDNNQIAKFDAEYLLRQFPKLEYVTLNNNSFNCEDLVSANATFKARNVVLGNHDLGSIENFQNISCSKPLSDLI